MTLEDHILVLYKNKYFVMFPGTMLCRKLNKLILMTLKVSIIKKVLNFNFDVKKFYELDLNN